MITITIQVQEQEREALVERLRSYILDVELLPKPGEGSTDVTLRPLRNGWRHAIRSELLNLQDTVVFRIGDDGDWLSLTELFLLPLAAFFERRQ